MLITAIEPRRKSLRALYLDGELAVNIDAQTLLSSRFQVGTEITDEELHELLAASDANRASSRKISTIPYGGTTRTIGGRGRAALKKDRLGRCRPRPTWQNEADFGPSWPEVGKEDIWI